MSRSDLVCDGVIVSSFTGFDGHSKFKFDDGQIWQQAEYKHAYHYAYRPQAVVTDSGDGLVLRVKGMSATVCVRRIK
jgi:hypothetical protein